MRGHKGFILVAGFAAFGFGAGAAWAQEGSTAPSGSSSTTEEQGSEEQGDEPSSAPSSVEITEPGSSPGGVTTTTPPTAPSPAAPSSTATGVPGSATTPGTSATSPAAPAPSQTATPPAVPAPSQSTIINVVPPSSTTQQGQQPQPSPSGEEPSAAPSPSGEESGSQMQAPSGTAQVPEYRPTEQQEQQEQQQMAPVQPIAPYSEQPYAQEQKERPKFGAGVMLGGGVLDFTRSGADQVTNPGGNWDARLVLGTRQYLGFEAAYVGSANPINALGLDNNAVLVGNGAEGALRVNVPLVRRGGLIAPFAFVGAGWQRFDVTNTAVRTASIAENDNIVSVPYGAGLAFGYGGFIADARFTYRSTFYNDLLRTGTGEQRLDNWSANARVGFEF